MTDRASRVSVIVVTYRSRDLVDEALASASAAASRAGVEAEIIVVDNASPDGTADHVAATHPEVQLIRNAKNVGFGRANDQAFGRATGDAWLLLNPDARLDPDALVGLFRQMAAAPRAGAVAPGIEGPGGAESAGMLPGIRSALGHFLLLNRVPGLGRVGRLRGFQLRRQHGSPVRVEWASAAALLVRPQAMRAIDGFDPRYFLYGEDTDLGARLGAAGWELWLVPAARAWHAIAGSSASPSTRWLEGLDMWMRLAGRGRGRRAAFFLIAAVGLAVRAVRARRTTDDRRDPHRRRMAVSARAALSLALDTARGRSRSDASPDRALDEAAAAGGRLEPGSRVAVLGAGALGLTVAWRLATRGHRVTVYERERTPGGLAAGFEIEPGIWLDRFYHHLFRSDRSALALIEEVGLRPALTWHRPLTATLRDGRIHQLDSPVSLLRFRPLPLVDRLRMGIVLAFLRALPSPAILEGRTAASWIRRTMGDASWRVVWGPLLVGKFGAAAERIAMPWFWARVHDRTAELGYLDGSFQRVYDRLAERIVAAGGELRLGTTVERVVPTDTGWVVEAGGSPDSEPDGYDAVISSLPTRLTCRLVPALPDDYRERYEWGEAYGAHCLILSLDRPVTDVYWLNVNDPGYPFMALVEHTNFQPLERYGGRHLVYLGNYRPMDDPLFRQPLDAVVDDAIAALRRLRPDLDRTAVQEAWMFGAPFAQPIVTVEYRDRIPPFATPLPGLWVANMFQVYPHDRGQNYSIELADRLIRAIDG